MKSIRKVLLKGFDFSKAIPEAVAIGLLVWALFPFNPYGYYVFLKIVVFGVTGYLALQAHTTHRIYWMYIFIGIAILYNPFIRVHFDREIWFFINMATIAVIARFSWLLQKKV